MQTMISSETGINSDYLNSKQCNLSDEAQLSKPAVVWYAKEGRKCCLSYRRLMQEIHQRANHFVETLQIKKGDVVAVLASRGPEYLINMLTLWRIGAVYLPLSDAWTELGALSNRLMESKAVCLLTVDATRERFKGELEKWHPEGTEASATQRNKRVFCLETPRDAKDAKLAPTLSGTDVSFPGLLPNQAAYIFSSSGTTGKPKLIQLPHAGILDRIEDHIDYMEIQPGDGVLGFIDFGFDASVVEMLIAVRSGNTLFIAPQEVRGDQSYQQLPHFIQEHAPVINVGILLPSVLMGLKPEHCPGLTKIVTMGEACLLDQLQKDRWFESASIYNGYGPTETTFGASLTKLTSEDTKPSIHRPMKGVTLYLRESFSLLFVTREKSNEKDTETSEKNVFCLRYSSDKQCWQYAIDYTLAVEGLSSVQALLPVDWNEKINAIKEAVDKSNTPEQRKEAEAKEAILLAELIAYTVKKPRLFAKSEGGKLVPIELGKAYFINQEVLPLCGEILISSEGMGAYLNLPDLIKPVLWQIMHGF